MSMIIIFFYKFFITTITFIHAFSNCCTPIFLNNDGFFFGVFKNWLYYYNYIFTILAFHFIYLNK